MRKAILALVLLVPLSGCATWNALTTANQPVSTISPAAADALNVAKKGLTAAYSLHKATADVLTALAVQGSLHGANAARAKDLLDQSKALLDSADALIVAADSTGIENKVAAAVALIAQAQAIATGH
jgi:uncharacterized protein YceK